MTPSLVPWLLVLFVGIPMAAAGLSRFLITRGLKGIAQAEKSDLPIVPFEALAWPVREALSGQKRVAEAAGLSELVTFYVPSPYIPEFHCVMIAPDRTTIFDIQFLRPGLFGTLVILVSQPRTLLNGLFGIRATELITVFENYFQLVTVSNKQLSSWRHREKEFLFQQERLPLPERIAAHSARCRAIETERGFAPKRFAAGAEYIAMRIKLRGRRAAEARRIIEEAASDLDEDVF
jgi:hypothetical protein